MTLSPRPVRIVRDEHGVHLDPHSPSVVGSEVLTVPGGVIRVDPGRPQAPPSLSVFDVEDSLSLVDELWGSAVAAALEGEAETQEVLGSPGPGLVQISTLATLRWLRRWRPVPLDPDLLALEVAAVSYRCRELVEVEPADLLELQDSLRMVAQLTADMPMSQLMAGLLHDCLVGLEQDRPETAAAVGVALRTLQHIVGVATSAQTAQMPAPTWLDSLAPQRALAADAGREARLAGVASVDWFRVRSPRVGREEDGVHWSIDQSVGSAQLCVVASAAPSVPPHPMVAGHHRRAQSDGLRFRLQLAGWPLPAAEGELRQTSPSEPWAGAVPLTRAVAAAAEERGPRGVTVDVASVGQRTPPATGDQALVRTAARWGARAAMGRRALASDLPLTAETRESIVSGVVANCRAALVVLDELEASEHPEAVSAATDWLDQVAGWAEEARGGTGGADPLPLTVSEQWAFHGRAGDL